MPEMTASELCMTILAIAGFHYPAACGFLNLENNNRRFHHIYARHQAKAHRATEVLTEPRIIDLD
jgi:hypothetical protein